MQHGGYLAALIGALVITIAGLLVRLAPGEQLSSDVRAKLEKEWLRHTSALLMKGGIAIAVITVIMWPNLLMDGGPLWPLLLMAGGIAVGAGLALEPTLIALLPIMRERNRERMSTNSV